MWRWQSLRDFVLPGILVTRDLYQDKRVINGLEWNVPGHEHRSTGIVADDANTLSAFEYQFDACDTDFKADTNLSPFGILLPPTGDNQFYFSQSDVTADFIVVRLKEQLPQWKQDNGCISW